MKKDVTNTNMYKKTSSLLLLIMIIGTFLIAFIEFSNNNFTRILTYLAVIPVLIIPFVLNKLKFKMNDKEIFAYYFFVFLTCFLGCVVNLYNNLSWYDLLVHFLSGIFTYVFGNMIYKRISKSKDNKIVRVIFCLGNAALIAIFWEVFEFGADNILKTNLQHNLDTGVNDTMWDLVVATIGSLIAFIFDLVSNTKRYLFIKCGKDDDFER